MTKKPILIGLLAVSAFAAALLVFPGASGQAAVNSKKERAFALWKMSGHADKTGEAFKHWNADSPAVVPASCARCHSAPGYQDYINGLPAKDIPVGTTVECEVCHTDREKGILRPHTSVTFPSGVTIDGLGPDGLCMECHQGRASKATVDAALVTAKVPDDDTVNKSIRFTNIHYFAAAADQFGTVVKGGYEYAGNIYDSRFAHIPGYNACNTCHSAHSLRVNIASCTTCHAGVKDPRDIRHFGSFTDYDGDGDIEEGMAYEVEDMMAELLLTIKAYALNVAGKAIAYDAIAYPYFFLDLNGNGVVDSDEATSANGYNAFTGRLLKACYNYQLSVKDPNGYAHNGKYIIELLYDSMADLNRKLAKPMDLTRLSRGDEGHFNGATEPWRHWDVEGQVPATCSKCHSATGLAYYLKNGTTQAEPVANGMLCTTCHTAPPALRSSPPVLFPSGLSASLGDPSDLCLNCHQGRESKASVDAAIAAKPSGPYSFKNVHYFAAGATFLGSEVKVAYEFPGKVYAGRQAFANHGGRFNTCVQCHMSKDGLAEKTPSQHDVTLPVPSNCVICHGTDISQPRPGADPELFDVNKIRPGSIPDYDADGNIRESLQDEILGLENALYAQIQAYASSLGTPILYSSTAYPYWFKDLNGNGVLDADEAVSKNAYPFDARLLRTAFNLQLSLKEPHGFIHNARYIAQFLVDSIGHLGGNTAGYGWR